MGFTLTIATPTGTTEHATDTLEVGEESYPVTLLSNRHHGTCDRYPGRALPDRRRRTCRHRTRPRRPALLPPLAGVG